MTGAEHKAEAERLLAQAEVDSRDPMRKYAEDANLIAAAQVHATLAIASANLVGFASGGFIGGKVNEAVRRGRRS
jgi:hypothetical protein